MKKFALGIAACLIAAPVTAQGSDSTITATNPQGIVDVLEIAGYEPELTKDDIGDPMIKMEILGWPSSMVFYDCDEATNADCQSVQLLSGFDRKEPWPASEAIAITSKYRYAAIQLDDEGDPWVAWDIVTGDGIPTKVFMRALREFGRNLDAISNVVFEKERAEEAQAE